MALNIEDKYDNELIEKSQTKSSLRRQFMASTQSQAMKNSDILMTDLKTQESSSFEADVFNALNAIGDTEIKKGSILCN